MQVTLLAAWKGERVDKELGTIVWPNGADLAPYSLYDLGKPAAKKIKRLFFVNSRTK